MKNTHYSTSTLALSLPSIAVPILASLSHPSCPAGQGLTGWKAFQIGHVTPFQRATSPFTRATGWQANWMPRQQQQATRLSSKVCSIIPYFLSLAYLCCFVHMSLWVALPPFTGIMPIHFDRGFHAQVLRSASGDSPPHVKLLSIL
jgi:hypothetical protein